VSIVLTVVAGAGACVRPLYRPGALTQAADGGAKANARRVGDCLDLAVERVASREVARDGRALLSFAFANGCDRTIPVDLRALRVTGTCGDHGSGALEAFDPRREIAPGRLAPYSGARERIAYGAPNCREVPRGICLGVSLVTRPSGGALGVLDPSSTDPKTTICLPDDDSDAGAAATLGAP
jgi:hypothetical protein